MSCAANPNLCGAADLVLRGPIAQPPQSGWRIQTLPSQASHLQGAWNAYPGEPSGAKASWGMMYDFLKANGVQYTGLLQEIIDIGTEQFCAPEPWRCVGWTSKAALKAPDLPWAKAQWEASNQALSNNLEPADVGPTLRTLVSTLTSLISSPTGCGRCYSHWLTHLEAHPVPAAPTLDEARHWLVDIHNLTREGKTPTPFETVKEKFQWL